MARLNNYHFLLILILTTLVALASARGPPSVAGAGQLSLERRLKVDAESPNCWDSLIELQACTGEVIMFFLNGETYLGAGCCRAIRVIGEQCWPAMFGSIGFTTEEADVLQGFCEALVGSSPPSPPPPPPASSHSPAHQPASASSAAERAVIN